MAEQPAELRYRASVLRRSAQELRQSCLAGLLERGNEQTWLGPTATRFRGDVARHRRSLEAAAETLDAHARRLYAWAEQLEAEKRRAEALARLAELNAA